MPNCRTDMCTYDYAYSGKCYHCCDCEECDLVIVKPENGLLMKDCKCQIEAMPNVTNDINYNCPYFKPLRREDRK